MTREPSAVTKAHKTPSPPLLPEKKKSKIESEADLPNNIVETERMAKNKKNKMTHAANAAQTTVINSCLCR